MLSVSQPRRLQDGGMDHVLEHQVLQGEGKQGSTAVILLSEGFRGALL